MEKQIIQQRIWEGKLETLPVIVTTKTDIIGIDKRSQSAPSLKPSCYLIDSNGNEVLVCSSCLNRGISSCLAVSKWTLTSGTDPKLRHAIDADIKIICNGVLNHKSKDYYSLEMIIKIT